MTTHEGPRFVRRPPHGAPPVATEVAPPEGPPDLDEFRQRLAEADARFSSLREAIKSKAEAEPERVLLELDVALEELRTADEELRAQGEEIAQATRSLETERSRYRELFDFAPDPGLVTDPNGKIVAANRASAGLFNAPAHKLPGRFLISFVRLGERSAFRERMAAALQSRCPLRWEATLAPPSHREPPPEIAVAIAAGADLSGSLLWTFRDVSERRRQEAKMRALNEELERRVVERTRELEASRLALEDLLTRERDARQQAEREGHQREEFMALVSHELRSPLHALLGWARLAAESDDPETLRKALRVVERNGRSMAALVDDLLDFARIERGELALSKERLPLGDLLAALCASLQPGASARALPLAFEREAGFEPAVEGDRVRLEQIFANLLANALKFTPPGGRVTLRLAREGDRAAVRVEDTGQGIGPELLPHVFDRFRQGEGGPQGARRGLGLGLAIVRQLVALHGGSVRAESDGAGKGSTFTVCLPVVA
ncbi:MAG TPA: ATP-binding protein [Polyangiaceae bacterium]|nr:ATP-binding protein [Polyangiaceae bacterium]